METEIFEYDTSSLGSGPADLGTVLLFDPVVYNRVGLRVDHDTRVADPSVPGETTERTPEGPRC